MSLPISRIVVLKGGPSEEREVSLRSGAAVAQALKLLGYHVTEVIVDGPNFRLPRRTEFVFLSLHGTFGEDGQVQQILKDKGIPYSGSGVATCQRTFAKDACKRVFHGMNILTPTSQLLRAHEKPHIPLPIVLKPNCQGSSIGLQFVFAPEQLDFCLSQARKFGDEVIAEQFIKGREMTVGILGSQTLPIVEIIPKEGFYDYINKYTPGATEYVCPAQLSAAETEEIQQTALHAHQALHCRAYSRIDLILDSDGKAWFLEVNTAPGMTATSLLPKAAQAAGVSFLELCERIVFHSLEESED
jgi:D-alanine-D-alanine ligase